jgi:hypothetical protein
MDLYTVQETVLQLQGQIESDCKLIPAHKLGLDRRCGFLYVGEDFVASTSPKELDYYGGFEYIDPEYTLTLGIWKLYLKGDRRIDNLPCWDEKEA